MSAQVLHSREDVNTAVSIYLRGGQQLSIRHPLTSVGSRRQVCGKYKFFDSVSLDEAVVEMVCGVVLEGQ